jgi:hypothetical protein
LPLSSLIPRNSAASRRRRTVGLAGAIIGRPSSAAPRGRTSATVRQIPRNMPYNTFSTRTLAHCNHRSRFDIRQLTDVSRCNLQQHLPCNWPKSASTTGAPARSPAAGRSKYSGSRCHPGSPRCRIADAVPGQRRPADDEGPRGRCRCPDEGYAPVSMIIRKPIGRNLARLRCSVAVNPEQACRIFAPSRPSARTSAGDTDRSPGSGMRSLRRSSRSIHRGSCGELQE